VCGRAVGVDANGQRPLEVPVMSLPLRFPKLSRFDRTAGPVRFAAPFPEGALQPDDAVAVLTNDAAMPTRARPTATWPDGSAKWLLVDALIGLPGDALAGAALEAGASAPPPESSAHAEVIGGSATLHSGPLTARLCGRAERGLISEISSLAHARELKGAPKYLRAGMTSFELSLQEEMAGWSGARYVDGDAVIAPKGPGPKAFAACFIPIARFHRAAVPAGLLAEEEASAQKGKQT